MQVFHMVGGNLSKGGWTACLSLPEQKSGKGGARRSTYMLDVFLDKSVLTVRNESYRSRNLFPDAIVFLGTLGESVYVL